MDYRALNCRCTLGAGSKDSGTGRCRLSSEQFKSLAVNMGWILKISLSFTDSEYDTEILCTAWPDPMESNHASSSTDEIISESSPGSLRARSVICVDDTVQFSSSRMNLNYDWMECNCKIVQVYPPSVCTSVRMTMMTSNNLEIYSDLNISTDLILNNNNEGSDRNTDKNTTRAYHPCAFSGLPVASGVIIKAAGKLRKSNAIIR